LKMSTYMLRKESLIVKLVPKRTNASLVNNILF
jgi:hypothetical protein